MSSIKLSPNASGTGEFTIAAPNSNTNRTLTLPDATGTVQVSGAAISGTTGTFTGLVDISAAGAGQIKFPATQNASSDANTLDDYEEGTWTPSVGGNATYGAQQNGRYIKIGRLVWATFDMSINVIGTGSTQLVSGLPFVQESNSPANPGGSVSYFAGLASGVYFITPQMSGASIAFITVTSLQTTPNNVASCITSGTRILATVIYNTAS